MTEMSPVPDAVVKLNGSNATQGVMMDGLTDTRKIRFGMITANWFGVVNVAVKVEVFGALTANALRVRL